jgi:hypothetical protein
MDQTDLAPSRRLLLLCTADGQVAAVPPTNQTNSRRRISVPKLRRQHRTGQAPVGRRVGK